MKKMVRLFAVIAACLLPWLAYAEEVNEPSSFKAVSYDAYIEAAQAGEAETTILINCAEAMTGQGLTVMPGYLEETSDCLLLQEGGSAQCSINVEQAGLYAIKITYGMGEEGVGAFAFKLLVDGELPYEEAREIAMARLFQDEGEQKIDVRGNDVRLRQQAMACWQTRWAYDSEGYHHQPLQIYLSEGEHTLTFESLRDNAVLSVIELTSFNKARPYAEVKAEYDEKGYRPVKTSVTMEAEKALYKTDSTLQAMNDRSSPSVSPYRGAKIAYNAIGGESWKTVGQEITWRIEAPEDGLYQISLKGKQNISAGQPSHRKLLIDGELPFEEAAAFSFDYSLRWQNLTLADENGEPYLFYLTKGEHTLTLVVSLGETAQIVKELDECVSTLNDAYRKIIMITGTSPDVYRDYNLDKTLPDVLNAFETEAERLTRLCDSLVRITGVKGESGAMIERMAVQLQSFVDRPRTIAKRLDVFKSNLSGLSSLILTLSEQYLTLDTITYGDLTDLPAAEADFFSRCVHSAKVFLASFTEDYNSVGEVTDDQDALVLWVSTGRDQAEVIRRLVDESFTSRTGIAVEVKLVPSGVLLSATLADMNPDVVIQLGSADPVNYAMRGALVDLAQFEDFEEVCQDFIDDAMVPYTYKDGVYALPETMSFPVMFYRKDIMQELNLKVPTTWDEFYVVLGELQKNNLEIGLPYTAVNNYTYGTLNGGMSAYMMFLSQLNGTLYTEDGQRSNITSKEGVQAFRIWTNLYANYQLPLTYDFANRFRLGEMPLAIADYTTYNLLQVMAPEIQGLWDWTVVPGMAQEDGSIINTVPFTSTACSIMRNNNDMIEESWAFLKWWVSADTQLSYGMEMESRLGASARYAAANLKTLSQLPWSGAEYAVIKEQMSSLVAVPEVPGGYFTPRHIDNAFRAVVYSGEDAHDTLLDYVRYIDDELRAKQLEFAD